MKKITTVLNNIEGTNTNLLLGDESISKIKVTSLTPSPNGHSCHYRASDVSSDVRLLLVIAFVPIISFEAPTVREKLPH